MEISCSECSHTCYPAPVCVRSCSVIDFTHGPRGEAGAQGDNPFQHFQAHNKLSFPEGLGGRCWAQPVPSLLMEKEDEVAVCEMLMVLLKIVLCF